MKTCMNVYIRCRVRFFYVLYTTFYVRGNHECYTNKSPFFITCDLSRVIHVQAVIQADDTAVLLCLVNVALLPQLSFPFAGGP